MSSPEFSQRLANFFKKYTKQQYPAGHVVIPAFSNPPGIYLVVSGHIKQYTLTPQGHELVVNIYKPGAFFPMIWAMTELPNSYFFEAIEEVTLYRAPTKEVLEFLKQEPEVLFDLLKRVYIGLDGLLHQLTYSAVGSTRHKVIASLLMMAKRFGSIDGSSAVIKHQITHQEIGQLSGTSREYVTRTLGQLESQGLISINRKVITIVDLNALEQELLKETGA